MIGLEKYSFILENGGTQNPPVDQRPQLDGDRVILSQLGTAYYRYSVGHYVSFIIACLDCNTVQNSDLVWFNHDFNMISRNTIFIRK